MARKQADQIKHTPGRQLAQWLIDKGWGNLPDATKTEWPVSVGERNKQPIQQLVVTDLPTAKLEGTSHRTGATTTKPEVQVLIYTPKTGPGHIKAVALQALIDGCKDQTVTIDSKQYKLSCARISGIMNLGKDKSDNLNIHAMRISITGTQPIPTTTNPED